MRSRSNRVIAFLLLGFVGVGFSYPFLMRATTKDQSDLAHGPLPRGSGMRGAYINSSSVDIGRDPNYKPPNNRDEYR